VLNHFSATTGYEPFLTQMENSKQIFNGKQQSWFLFKRRFRGYIRENKPTLLPLLEDNATRPQQLTDEWDKLNATLFDQLLLWISDVAASHMKAAKDDDGVGAWKLLKNHYEVNTAEHIVNLIDELTSEVRERYVGVWKAPSSNPRAEDRTGFAR
jgi:hypothetical protein